MRDLIDEIEGLDRFHLRGRVDAVKGLLIEATAPVAAVALGASARVELGDRTLDAEIVGFRDDRALLMPFGALDGVRAGAPVGLTTEPATARPSTDWLGRVLDAFGRPIDGGPSLRDGRRPVPLRAEPPSPGARGTAGAAHGCGCARPERLRPGVPWSAVGSLSPARASASLF